MKIKQWQDKNLAQFSYAILSDTDKKVVLIDPSRNPQPYLDYAFENNAVIAGIIETHPHADFVSSHLELSKVTGVPVYTGSLVAPAYAHKPLRDGEAIEFGDIKLIALDTPGHSPDSISILLEHKGRQKAVFSGDALFIGDCGRPDLREGAGNLRSTRAELAKAMYHSLRNKYLPLADDVILYPAHGAGTLCGKGLSDERSSTMGREKQTNWSLQSQTEAQFVEALLIDQPFIPAYFPFDVELNRKGASPFRESIARVKIGAPVENKSDVDTLNKEILIIDARNEKDYKKAHLSNSINLMEGAKFETWLGSIIKPGEPFYLAGENIVQLEFLIERAAAIGYETQIREAFVLEFGIESDPVLDVNEFKNHPDNYTIIDIRNDSEIKKGKTFKQSIAIPLPELRNRISEIPTDKPVIVHCAGGYRSAAGSSIINLELKNKVPVFDLGEEIKQFAPANTTKAAALWES